MREQRRGDQPAHVGRYRVSAVLGSGSFGTVYLGSDPTIGSPVAVKVLDRDRTDDQASMAALRSEADAMRRIQDRHCVRVIDVVDEPDVTAIVTELIDGASLRAVLTRAAGRLTGPQALDVMRGALLGLTAVHTAGLIHGDVKPDNILVDRRGVSRLIDFGLARPQGAVSADGSVAGSPAYMSPEQITGHQVTGRSDIYACAAVLFELLTGRRPYVSDRVVDVARMHLNAPVPDPREFEPTLAADLAQLCMKGLSKDPADRYATAADFLAALEQAAQQRYGAAWRTGLGLGALAGAAAALITHAVAQTDSVSPPITTTPESVSSRTPAAGHRPRSSSARRISRLTRRSRIGASAVAAVVATAVIVVVAGKITSHPSAAAGTAEASTTAGPASVTTNLVGQPPAGGPTTPDTVAHPTLPATTSTKSELTTHSTGPAPPPLPAVGTGESTTARATAPARAFAAVAAHAFTPVAAVAANTYYSASCPTSPTCLAVGKDAAGQPILSTTTDSGLTWHTTYPPVAYALGLITCTSPAHCIGAQDTGHSDALVVSDDAGATWQPASAPPLSALHSTSCPTANDCLAVGGDERSGLAESVASTDGGHRWHPVTAPGPAISLDCIDATHCWAVGTRAWFSADLGQSWRTIPLPSDFDQATGAPPPTGPGRFFGGERIVLNGVAFGSDTDGIVFGGAQCGGQGVTKCASALFSTHDGGDTWTFWALTDVTRYGDGTFAVCRDTACLLRTDTFTNSVLASTTDGTTWTTRQTFDGYLAGLACAPAGGTCLALAKTGIYVNHIG
ncbi:Protein kinase domain-containing protein [Nakamurella panacisegetis]|uniref:non-specific serine/threonine protein kinase n=1 Tax=Nakamurella panacisegetis TaxID=1090615 RepID=A0A1H0N761_9ACTN|nr:serine/threonine-protein kinase [Nakamurella panacisegetis]SDO88569.1 Protein kinase domain-containing protein [Nakamurella panacisegetis]